MNGSITKIEATTKAALTKRLAAPFLGGHRANSAPPAGSVAILPDQTGYVCHVNMGALQEIAGAAGLRVHLAVLPWALVYPARPLLWQLPGDFAPESRETQTGSQRDAFAIVPDHSFDQNPCSGLCVLTETAERALRLLLFWPVQRVVALGHPNLWVSPLKVADLPEDMFPPIARDAAGNSAEQMRLHKGCWPWPKARPMSLALSRLPSRRRRWSAACPPSRQVWRNSARRSAPFRAALRRAQSDPAF